LEGGGGEGEEEGDAFHGGGEETLGGGGFVQGIVGVRGAAFYLDRMDRILED
jgi:hypothetical protein